jgi:hypothetical protein
VDIPVAKIALRPGFPLSVLADADARENLLDSLRWFHGEAQMSADDELDTV